MERAAAGVKLPTSIFEASPRPPWYVENLGQCHAFYEMAAMVQGRNMVRRELGPPEAACFAADPRFSLTA